MIQSIFLQDRILGRRTAGGLIQDIGCHSFARHHWHMLQHRKKFKGFGEMHLTPMERKRE